MSVDRAENPTEDEAAAVMSQRYAAQQRLHKERKKAELHALETRVNELQQQVDAVRLECVHDRAQLDTMAAYAAQRGASPGGREVDVRKLQLQMDPSEQAAEGRQQDGSFALDERGAALVAGLVAAVRGPGAPCSTAAECARVSTGLMRDLYETLKGRVWELIQQGAAAEGSPEAAELERQVRHFQLLWSMTDASAVWAASPALYYATFFELVDAAEAEHGPWPLADFHAKVAAMQLSPSQQAELEIEADAMAQRLRGIVRRHKALVLDVCRAPLTPPSSRPDRATIADTHRLVQQLQGALGEYGGAFWDRLRPAQLARAVVATPYPLCAVSVGIHIIALKRTPGGSAADMQRVRGVMNWLRRDTAQAQTDPPGLPQCAIMPEALAAFAEL